MPLPVPWIVLFSTFAMIEPLPSSTILMPWPGLFVMLVASVFPLMVPVNDAVPVFDKAIRLRPDVAEVYRWKAEALLAALKEKDHRNEKDRQLEMAALAALKMKYALPSPDVGTRHAA